MNKLTYTFDDNYLFPFLLSAYSAHLVFERSLVIRIIQPHDSKSIMALSPSSIKIIDVIFTKLDINYEIIYINTSTFSENNLTLWAKFTPATWLRYYFIFNADLLTEEYIYYIDPDTLFISSTNKIFEIVPTNIFLYARISPGHLAFETKWKSNFKTSPWYFNCGVMVINLNKWQKELNQNNWWETVGNWSALEFSVIDQDALNYLIRGKQAELPIEFNCYPSELLSNPNTSIIHYAGHAKPWFYSNYFLRLKSNKSTRVSINKWYAIRKKFVLDIGKKNLRLIESPPVKFSTKLNIVSPNLTNLLYSFKNNSEKLRTSVFKYRKN